MKAAVRTWDGGGTDYNWGTAANWDAAVVNGDDLVLTGTVRLNSSNSIVPLRINSLAYTSSGFTNFGQGLMITNGIVDIAGGNTNLMAITLGGSQSISNQSSLLLVLGGTIAMSNYNLTVSSTGGGTNFLNGVISGNGLVGVNYLNIEDGVTRLAGANTFNGGVNINSGTLMLANGAAIPSGASRGDVNIASGATLHLNANSQGINGLNGAGTVDNFGGTATYTLTVGNANSNGVFSGNIANTVGTVALTKVGTGTQTLSGPNSYAGLTLINQGTLALGAGGSIVSTNIRVASGALLDVTGAGGLTLDGNLNAGRVSGFTNDIVGNVTINGGNVIPVPGLTATMTIEGNLTLAGIPSLNFDLKNVSTVGGGVNDLISVTGTVDVAGGTIPVKLNPVSGALSGTYTLITSTNTISGSPANFTFDAPRGLSATFDTTTQPSNVLMTASGSPNPASLVWAGNGAGGNWDVLASQSWLSNGVPDYFYNLDPVTFNDAAGSANAIVSLPGAVSPGSVTINNNSVNYTLGVGNVDPGLISGTGGLTKQGTGIATLNGGNNFTGNTTVNGGILVLGQMIANPDNVPIYNGVTPGNLTLGGGGVFLVDQGNITYRANFNNVTLNPGGNSMSMRARSSSSSYIFQLASFTRNVGGTIEFNNIQSKNASPQVGLFITNQPTVNGILGGWATITTGQGGGTDWVVPTNQVANSAGSYALPAAQYQTSVNPALWTATTNVNLTASTSPNVNDTTINSLKLANSTVTINSGQTLTLASGGVLVPNAGAAATITGGTLKGAPSADLVVFNHSSAGALTVGSVIADNAGASALTKAGQGTLILAGNNTYTGPTYIGGSTVSGSAANNAAITAIVTVPGGTLQIGNGGTSGGISNTPSILDNGTLAFNRSDTIGYSVLISGVGGIRQSGSGTTILTANNTYSGLTTISGGTLQIGNGGSTGSFSNSVGVANAGSLVINRTGALAYGGQINGIGSLTLQGGVNVTLKTNSTYSGSTTISAGKLVLSESGSISNTALINVASGAVLDASAAGGITLSGLGGGQVVSGTGGVRGDVTSGGNTRITPAGDGTIGTLTLSNALTLNGGTVTIDVNGGSRDLLDVKGNLDLTSGTIVINNLGGAIPNGTYKLIGYSGSLSGAAGNLTISGFSQAGQLASLTAAGGEVDLVVVTGFGANLTWLGDGAANLWNLIGDMNFTNSAGVVTNFHNNDNVNFTDAGAVNPLVAISGSLAPAAVVVNSTTDYTFQGSGNIGGGSSLIKSGPNNLNILTTNSYSGPTTISGGTLTLGNGIDDGALGSGKVTNNAALVFNNVGSQNASGAISGSGTLAFNGTGTTILIGDNSQFSGSTAINAGTVEVGAGGAAGTLGTGSIVNNSTLVINRSGSLTVGASISGSGILTNGGPGAVTLSGANSYSGNTIIAGGTVKAGAAGAIPSGAGVGNVVLDGSASATGVGILDLNAQNVSINGLAGVNGTFLGQVVNNSGTATNTLTLGNGDATATFSGAIKDNSGSGGKVALIKTGTGTQTLDVTTAQGNSYSGGTVISNGVLAITSPGGGTPVNAGANAVALGSGPVTFYGGTLTPAGAYNQNATPTWFPFMANTFIVPLGQTGIVNAVQRGGINSALIGGGTFFYNTAYVRGEMGGDWSAFTGQIILSGNVNGGQMGLNIAAGMPNARVSMTTNVTLYGRIAGTPTIPIGELADGDDSDSIVSTSPANAGGAAANFMIGGLNTSTNFNGRILDSVGIIKVGLGSWTLTNANISYTGTTTVSNGVLVLAGSIPNSTTFGIASPGRLDVTANITTPGTLTVGGATVQTVRGNGRLDGSLDVQALGVVNPGFTNAIGTLTVSNAVTLAGEVYMELNRTNSVGGTNDQIAAVDIALGGTLTVTNTGSALAVGNTFKLFKASGVLSGTLGVVNLPATDANNMAYTWTDNTAVDGTITVLTAVPLVNLTPADIISSVSGDTLTLSWPTDHIGWKLQVQTNPITSGLSSNWFDVPGSTTVDTMNFTINPANGSVFYRMVYP